MEPAVIIVSLDYKFVSHSINRLLDDSYNTLIERCLTSADFEVLVNEFIKENIFSFSVLIDENISINEQEEIQDILDKYNGQIQYNFIHGLEMSDDFYDS